MKVLQFVDQSSADAMVVKLAAAAGLPIYGQNVGGGVFCSSAESVTTRYTQPIVQKAAIVVPVDGMPVSKVAEVSLSVDFVADVVAVAEVIP